MLALPAVPALAGEPAQTGMASYYGPQFAGRRTASGARLDPQALTAASRTLPFGTRARVTHVESGRSVIVEINDRGPYAHGRILDVTPRAAERLGMMRSGVAKVRVERISPSED